jgi:hypothetical protein
MLLALLAWTAQLCLPMAHAASMTQRAEGTAAWCASGASPAFAMRLAQLPPDIRHLVGKGRPRADASPDCSAACAQPGGAALPRPFPNIRPAAAEIEPRAAAPAFVPRAWVSALPPARGPPLRSDPTARC